MGSMQKPILLALVVVVACARPQAPETAQTSPAPASVQPLAEALSPDAAADAAAPLPPLVLDRADICATGRPPPESEAVDELDARRLDAIEAAVLAAPAPKARHPLPRWEPSSPPLRLEQAATRLAITAPERQVLRRERLVVLEHQRFDSYAVALHEVYQSQLPMYFSVDPLFHAIFVSHDELVATVEKQSVAPALRGAIDGMAKALPGRASLYAAETAADLDVYLTVARSLLAGHPERSSLGAVDAECSRLYDLATKADAMSEVSLFGRVRVVDFSQYAPRGHYARGSGLESFFRGAMWLSRLELNLVSRSSRSSQPGIVPNPEETPREAVDALALADLAASAGALEAIEKIDHGWGALSGAREDVPLGELVAIDRAGSLDLRAVPAAFAALKTAIGDRYRRTTRLHYMPQGSTELPAIATLLGPRVVVDAAATRPLVHGELPGRYDLGASDLGYALGFDRARRYLAADLRAFPDLGKQLDKARAILQAPGSPEKTDLYATWLGAVEQLARTPDGELPSFMQTDGFRDLRLSSAITAYGQIKHNHVLLAGQPYDEGACAVPDGYVDPAVGVYEALATYASRAGAAFRELDPADATGAQAYFARTGKILRVLRAIALEELSGAPLSPEALAFLSSVVEIHGVDIGSGFSTSYNGWYFDLFLTRPQATTAPPPGNDDHPAMKYAGFLADYYTSTNTGQVAYVGAAQPRLGVFVVDTGGPPRVVVGPVASGLELHAPLTRRLTDADVPALRDAQAPWAASCTVKPPPDPPLTIAVAPSGEGLDESKGRANPMQVDLQSTRPLGKVSVTLRDHNRNATATQSRTVAAMSTRFTFPARPQHVIGGTHGTEMVEVHVGDFSTFVPLPTSGGTVALGGMHVPAP
jgi:hypothetical protein